MSGFSAHVGAFEMHWRSTSESPSSPGTRHLVGLYAKCFRSSRSKFHGFKTILFHEHGPKGPYLGPATLSVLPLKPTFKAATTLASDAMEE